MDFVGRNTVMPDTCIDFQKEKLIETYKESGAFLGITKVTVVENAQIQTDGMPLQIKLAGHIVSKYLNQFNPRIQTLNECH